MKLLSLTLLAALVLPLPSARTQAPSRSALAPFAAQVAEVLTRSSDGHSPTPDEITASAAPTTQPGAADVAQALPYLLKALENPDAPVRTYALSLMAGLQQPPVAQAAPGTPPAPQPGDATADTTPGQPPLATVAPPSGTVAFRPPVAKALTPAIPAIAAHLTDEAPQNRLLAATILGGFTPDPPPSVYPPLLACLRRDDAVSPTGQAVFSDLLQLGPLSSETTEALIRYLHRSDQTSDARANLADAIASSQNQSQALNKSLLAFLDSDDPSLRARIILSLPALDLSQDVFNDTRSTIATLAADSSENLQVINAAKAVTTCWTAVRMTAGCPVYQ